MFSPAYSFVWLTYCTKNGKTYNNDMNFKMPYFVVKVQRLVKEILEYAVFRQSYRAFQQSS